MPRGVGGFGDMAIGLRCGMNWGLFGVEDEIIAFDVRCLYEMLRVWRRWTLWTLVCNPRNVNGSAKSEDSFLCVKQDRCVNKDSRTILPPIRIGFFSA